MLSLLGHLYGKVLKIRNGLYERGIFETVNLGARTISIGNITTGGTGKTPLVAYIANLLAERGEKVCILTRGYGRREPSKRVLVSDREQILADPADAGDEPFELAQKLNGKAVIIADADRVSAAQWAKQKFGVTTFLLDDGFQHRRAKRDLDIVCIDATNPFSSGKMLPAGRLREPLESLKRADMIVITRSDLVDDLSNLTSQISNLTSEIPIFFAKNKIIQLNELINSPDDQALLPVAESIKEKRAIAICALGNPDNFYLLLRQNGYDVFRTRSFPDHFRYSEEDIHEIENLARSCEVEVLITTAKDAVKLSDFKFQIPCYVVEIDVEFDDPQAFAALL